MNRQTENFLRRAQQCAGVVGTVCVIAACIGVWKNPTEFFRSYVFAYLFWIGIPIGSALVLCFANLTSAKWVTPVRTLLESASRSFFVNAVAGIPLLLGVNAIYRWPTDKESAFPIYLNTPLWVARAVVFLCAWTLLLTKITSRDAVIRPRWSAITAVLLPISATFAYVDWFMSIQSEWRSTAFGLTVLAGQILVALAVVLFLIPFNLIEIRAELDDRRLHQLGNLLLTFVLFWAYLAFSQFLIIYSANLPHEIGWYLRRIKGAWLSITLIIAIGQFFLPFLMLLFRRVKRSKTLLRIAAALIMVSNVLYCYWLIAPSFGSSGKEFSWLDPVLFLGLGAIYGFLLLGKLRRAEPLRPLGSVPETTEPAYAIS